MLLAFSAVVPFLLLKGFVLGWSVAWPPGPINAEMIRRGLERGFWPAWALGLGACSGDFLWAIAVSLGAGVLLNVPGVRTGMAILSLALLLFLAWTFGRGAWRSWQRSRTTSASSLPEAKGRFDTAHGGFFLGLTLALSSPWNIAFWLAVIGSQATAARMGAGDFLSVATGVFLAAGIWSFLVCVTARAGARYATPAWYVITQGSTAALMLFFAGRTAWRLATGA